MIKKTKSMPVISQWLTLVYLALFSNLVLAEHPPAYLLNENSLSENLGIYTQFLEDPEGKLTLEEVLHASEKTEAEQDTAPFWQNTGEEGLVKGFTKSVYWLRFKVRNIDPQAVRWYMEVRYPILDHIQFYSPNDTGKFDKIDVGDALPFNKRPIDYRNLVFMRNTLQGTEETYYLRIETTSSMYVPLQIWPHDTFFHEIDRVKLLLGILYGIVILALLISAVNAYFLKDIMYIWLSGILICFFLYLGSIKGVAFQTLWPNSLYWQEVSIPFFMNLSWAFGFMYSRSYLSLKDLSPFIDKTFKGFVAIGFVCAFACFIVPYKLIISLSTVMTIVTQILLSIVGAVSWYKGNQSARLFVLSWMCLIVGAVSFALIALGVLPRSFLTEWMQEIGFGSMVTLMIIAQFDRFLQIQKGHEEKQKASLKALKEAELKYRSLFQNAIEGIFQLADNGRLTNVNNAFASILGLDDTEHVVETRDTPFTLGFLSDSEAKKLESMLNSQHAISDYKVSFASPKGDIRWASISIQKVKHTQNDSFHYEGSLTDITETKKREQAEKQQRMAEASTEAKSLFLANMSHEIRTPMNAIIGFTDLAVNTNQDQKLASFLRKIKTSSSNLLGIINDILDFSKIEAGKLIIESAPFDIRELLNNIEEIVSTNIESKTLSFSIDIDEDIPAVLIGDSLRLHQVLLNLCNNAIKFTSDGFIKVELDLLTINKKTGAIRLAGRVIDSGIGIPESKLTKVFTSFSHTDENSTQSFGGTGLGLSISKQLINLMDGDIRVRSVEGKGSVFEFEFACRLESRKKSKSSHSASLNILVVDDNRDSRLLLENVILTLNHRYTSCNSAKEALELISRQEQDNHHFDIVMIDWLMPGMDGLECFEAISKLPYSRRLKSILITTYGEEGLEDRAKAQGFNYFMEKPISPSMLKRAIDTIFDTSTRPLTDTLTPKMQTSDKQVSTEQIQLQELKTNEEASQKDVADTNNATAELKESSKKCEVSTNPEEPVSSNASCLPELSESCSTTLTPIDLQDGLDRCQGNQTLYQKLLSDFIRNYSCVNEQLRACFNQNDFSSISKQAHTLKGLSANLGAIELSKTAMILEKISSMESIEQLPALESFEHALKRLLAFLTNYLAEHTVQEQETKNLPLYRAEEAMLELTQLSEMINEQKMDAYDKAIEMAKRWHDKTNEAIWHQLIEQLDLFDFEAARASVTQLQQA